LIITLSRGSAAASFGSPKPRIKTSLSA